MYRMAAHVKYVSGTAPLPCCIESFEFPWTAAYSTTHPRKRENNTFNVLLVSTAVLVRVTD